MKGADRYMEIILMAFPKNFLLGANEPFSKMVCPHNSGSAVRNVLQFCLMKRLKRVIEIILMFFPENSLIQGNLVGHFGPKMVHPHNFGSALGQ